MRRPGLLLAGALGVLAAWLCFAGALHVRAQGERNQAVALLRADRELHDVEILRWRGLVGSIAPIEMIESGTQHWIALQTVVRQAGTPALSAEIDGIAQRIAGKLVASHGSVAAIAADPVVDTLQTVNTHIDAAEAEADNDANRDARDAWAATALGGIIALLLVSFLMRAYLRAARAAAHALGERRALEARAIRDDATGLANRTGFEHWIEDALCADGGSVAAILLDLDDFGTINDSLGHAAGDRLLAACARQLRDAVGDDARLARLTGDEFALLLDDVRDAAHAEHEARTLLDVLDRPVRLDDGEVPLTASVGVAIAPCDGSAQELLRSADTAVHAAKRRGAGHVEVFTPEMHDEASRRLELRSALTRAIERDELTVAYQPAVDLETGHAVGVEALLRWTHEGVPISPADFIPLAEAAGLIVPLGERVLARACAEIAGRTLHGGDQMRVSVNVSAVQLRSPGFVTAVQRTLEESGLCPDSLILELTESTMIDDSAGVQDALRAIRAMGVRIAVDDFGTGWSSLATLASLPVDVLKLDRSFVARMHESPAHEALVGGVIAMAAGLGLPTVVEGVETREQLLRLRELGATVAQGFHLGRPGPLPPLASARCASSRSTAAGSAA